jgi:chemotaxis protein histidine kinase CheA
MIGQSVSTRNTTMLGVVLGILLALPAWAESPQVRGLRVSEAAGDTTVVISSTGRPTFTTWKLEQPARVVVDLSGARLGNLDVPMDAGTYAVGLIGASSSEDESGPRTRVVLTLRQPSDYRVETRGHDIVVRVIPQVRPAAATDSSESLAKSEAQTERALAQAKAEAEARAAAQVKADQALAQVKAETQAKTEAQKARAAAQVKADQAMAQVKAETQAKTEAQKERAAAQVKADQAMAQAKAEEKAKTEAQRERAAAQAKADQAMAQAKAEEKAKTEAQLRAQTQAQVAAQAHAENAKLKQLPRPPARITSVIVLPWRGLRRRPAEPNKKPS